MTKLLSAKDVAKAMSCTQDTARKYMRRMIHTEKPLRVTEAVFEAWVNRNSYQGSDTIQARAQQTARTLDPLDRIPRKHRGKLQAV